MTLSDYQTRIESVLNRTLRDDSVPPLLLEAMRYSMLGGGKRVRALLVYAAGEAVNASLEQLDIVAAALECVHGYSLIHDDLPAMDDDDLRRGKPTNHKQFNEATAILAGDALLTFAFELINRDNSSLSDQQARKITQILSTCAGASGMVGGQQLDMLATGENLTQDALKNIHKHKTGALVRAAVICGGLCKPGDELASPVLESLDKYGANLGLAFQVIDDILDVEASTQELGKTSGADEQRGKATYPSTIGLQTSKKLAKNLYTQAIACTQTIGDNTRLLAEIAELVITRRN